MNKPNEQFISKKIPSEFGKLQVHSIFPTIQGEGPFAGQPATFIRLYGCNLQCPMCDTDYTSKRAMFGIEEIEDVLSELMAPNKLVVITGGEPFRQDIKLLVNFLVQHSVTVQIETNGTLFVPGLLYNRITIVCSPKTGEVNKSLLPFIKTFKYVLHADDVDVKDGLPIHALGHPVAEKVYRPTRGTFELSQILVQPVDTGDVYENGRHLKAAKESCLKFGYTLSLQQHKIIGVN